MKYNSAIAMSKRGEAVVYVFLAFAVIALAGMTYTILAGTPEGLEYYVPHQDTPIDVNQFPMGQEEIDAGTGIVPIQDQPGMVRQPMMDCQSRCFGTERGEPEVGQRPMGGAELRKCMADCQAGIPEQQSTGQSCYTCSDTQEGITADNQDEAQTACQRGGGSSATITKVTPGPCKY